ncbi:MAG TPA: deoxyguanosinetriphosphate triphosphohydrolase [Myxococcota bacterium]|nr:deoxyguanosinetriphosphate triphosphohydrolase [Myxococcota bacterium]
MRTRAELEKREAESLAPYALLARDSRGRIEPEAPHAYRTAFQRDRDRVLHARAFRRLQYKTQVFPYSEGDHFRNRLTHTLEVAQIARTVARALGVNEDLVEAIVLSHDLGHPPFGHAGEHVLNGLLKPHGGFEHNRQSLRIVDWLEDRSERYPGLNLCHETRAGILKHGSTYPHYPHPVPLPDLGLGPSLEAQIANCCDEVAYHTHDLDDGLRAEILDWESLGELPLVRRALAAAHGEGKSDARSARAQLTVALIDLMATDLIEASARRLEQARPASAAAAAALPERALGFSPDVAHEKRELARFLFERFYRHHRVLRMAAKAERILGDLWRAYAADPRQLPPHVLERARGEPEERAIADYIAGMTDRFAMDEHDRLFDPHTHV